uniref:Cyclin-dependent kinase inhibitor domain-containing protein n=2 Tax=Junco hyemalis TaxID=40217 RepID=A0A8C5JTW5_JUNHY
MEERCVAAVSAWSSPTGRSGVGTAAPLRRGAGALGMTIAGGVPLLGADHREGEASPGAAAGPSPETEEERDHSHGRGTTSPLAPSPGLAVAPGQMRGNRTVGRSCVQEVMRSEARTATMPLSQSRAGQSPCSSKACRNLFGPVDHEQLQQDFEDQMKQQLEEAQQRWNFNFETETPLEGPFKWERMLVAEQAPKEVHSLVRAVISSDSRSSLAHRVPPKERGVGRICPEEAQQSSKVCRAGSLQGLKRGQTTIKDFYSAKRRIVPARPRP